MAEQDKKATIEYDLVEPDVGLFEKISQDRRGSASTTDKTSQKRYVYYYAIPKTDQEAQDRYKANLSTIINAGLTNRSYGLGFKDLIKAASDRGASHQEIANEVQKLVDSMTFERQVSVGKGAKAKAGAFDSLAGKYGVDTSGKSAAEIMTEIEARILKATGKKK
jgi:hypothetical protein